MSVVHGSHVRAVPADATLDRGEYLTPVGFRRRKLKTLGKEPRTVALSCHGRDIIRRTAQLTDYAKSSRALMHASGGGHIIGTEYIRYQ